MAVEEKEDKMNSGIDNFLYTSLNHLSISQMFQLYLFAGITILNHTTLYFSEYVVPPLNNVNILTITRRINNPQFKLCLILNFFRSQNCFLENSCLGSDHIIMIIVDIIFPIRIAIYLVIFSIHNLLRSLSLLWTNCFFFIYWLKLL